MDIEKLISSSYDLPKEKADHFDLIDWFNHQYPNTQPLIEGDLYACGNIKYATVVDTTVHFGNSAKDYGSLIRVYFYGSEAFLIVYHDKSSYKYSYKILDTQWNYEALEDVNHSQLNHRKDIRQSKMHIFSQRRFDGQEVTKMIEGDNQIDEIPFIKTFNY